MKKQQAESKWSAQVRPAAAGQQASKQAPSYQCHHPWTAEFCLRSAAAPAVRSAQSTAGLVAGRLSPTLSRSVYLMAIAVRRLPGSVRDCCARSTRSVVSVKEILALCQTPTHTAALNSGSKVRSPCSSSAWACLLSSVRLELSHRVCYSLHAFLEHLMRCESGSHSALCSAP